jgi:uncharacterized protein (DUF169 family)
MASEKKYSDLAKDLRSLLELEQEPIAIAFVEERPEGVPVFRGEVPSACSFWRQGERGVFYAPAAKHHNCAVGAMTMGFDIEPVKQRLLTTVQMMCDCGYIGSAEPEKIPTVKGGHAGIVYGPLHEFPVEADLALLWVKPRQAMLLNEASGGADWSRGSPLPVLGRPACTALPMALAQSRAMLSLGCLGMRTFTDISGDRMLAVLPGAGLKEIVDRLKSTVEANRAMAEVYNASKAAFAEARA